MWYGSGAKVVKYYSEAGYVNEKAVSMQNERDNLMRGESDRDDGIYETYDFGNKGRGDDEVYETPYSDNKYETPYQNSEHQYAEYAQPNNKVSIYDIHNISHIWGPPIHI